jgi:methyl-accepting chemotaxis protein
MSNSADEKLANAVTDVAYAFNNGEQDTVTLSIAKVGGALENVANSISEIPDRISSYRDNELSLSDAICQAGRPVREELAAQAEATEKVADATNRLAAATEAVAKAIGDVATALRYNHAFEQN